MGKIYEVVDSRGRGRAVNTRPYFGTVKDGFGNGKNHDGRSSKETAKFINSYTVAGGFKIKTKLTDGLT